MKKKSLIKGLIAGLFSSITIAALTFLTYKTQYGLFLIASFGSSMVLLYGYPESQFAQPKNIFFGHLLTSSVGILFVLLVPLPIHITIPLAVGFGVGLMVEILTSCIAGGNLGTQASSFAGEDGGPPSTGQFFIAINPLKFNSNFENTLKLLIDSITSQEGARLPGAKRQLSFQENKNKDIEISDALLSRINEI